MPNHCLIRSRHAFARRLKSCALRRQRTAEVIGRTNEAMAPITGAPPVVWPHHAFTRRLKIVCAPPTKSPGQSGASMRYSSHCQTDPHSVTPRFRAASETLRAPPTKSPGQSGAPMAVWETLPACKPRIPAVSPPPPALSSALQIFSIPPPRPGGKSAHPDKIPTPAKPPTPPLIKISPKFPNFSQIFPTFSQNFPANSPHFPAIFAGDCAEKPLKNPRKSANFPHSTL